MTLYLVRHAQAGSRSTWDGTDDQLRPLTPHGRRQSADLVGLLAEFPLTRVLTSPYLRCVETVAALGARVRLVVEQTEALAEGPADDAIALVQTLLGQDDGHAVLCSHGDIIPDLLDYFVRQHGIELGKNPRCQKGSVWMIDSLDSTSGSARAAWSATYVPPPGER
jgi:phosphohistidine phosphatase SixA